MTLNELEQKHNKDLDLRIQKIEHVVKECALEPGVMGLKSEQILLSDIPDMFLQCFRGSLDSSIDLII